MGAFMVSIGYNGPESAAQRLGHPPPRMSSGGVECHIASVIILRRLPLYFAAVDTPTATPLTRGLFGLQKYALVQKHAS